MDECFAQKYTVNMFILGLYVNMGAFGCTLAAALQLLFNDIVFFLNEARQMSTKRTSWIFTLASAC